MYVGICVYVCMYVCMYVYIERDVDIQHYDSIQTFICFCSQYFGYSLEKRIKPRYEKLVARGVTHISLPSMLACVESDFISRYLVGDPPSRAPYNLKKAPRRSKYTD